MSIKNDSRSLAIELHPTRIKNSFKRRKKIIINFEEIWFLKPLNELKTQNLKMQHGNILDANHIKPNKT